MARPLAHGEPHSAQVFPLLLCAAAMKRRAPGSQLAAQTVWMVSLLNPKLGACKFTPVLLGTGGSAGDGWLCWQEGGLVPTLPGMTGMELGCPVQG